MSSEPVVRRTKAALAAFAEQADLAILAVRHHAKGTARNAVCQGVGSIGIIAAARSALSAVNDTASDDPTSTSSPCRNAT